MKVIKLEKKLLEYCWQIFRGLLILLYSIIAGSSILGLLGVFRFWTASVLSICIAGLLFFYWGRTEKEITISPLDQAHSKSDRNGSLLSLTGFFVAGLLLLLIVIPILNWPMSSMENTLHWDAGLYHFPKAVEMWLTGSSWDFSISYGDYPYGYESLLSFTLLFTRNVGYFSIAHVLILFLLVFGTWFLALKYSRIPAGIILAAVVFLILSGFLDVFNPWYFLHYVPYTVGKNDLFLAAATISACVFIPLPKKQNKPPDWVGLGIASGLAVSIKPNSGAILLFLWIYGFIHTYLQKNSWKFMLSGLLIAACGGAWIIRNLIGIQKLFLPQSYRIVNWSIWSNITNPDFYQHLPKEFIFVIAFCGILIILSLLKHPVLGYGEALLFVVALISFVISPASLDPKDPTAIAWRFGLTMLLLQFVYLVALLEPVSVKLLSRMIRSKVISAVIASSMLILAVLFFYSQIDVLRLVPDNAGLVVRPYSDLKAKYLSVFDYIDQHIHNSTIWVEGAPGFYAYDPQLTNSVSRKDSADYIVLVSKPPEDLWFDISSWDLIYQDSQGSIFKNPSSRTD